MHLNKVGHGVTINNLFDMDVRRDGCDGDLVTVEEASSVKKIQKRLWEVSEEMEGPMRIQMERSS